MEPAQPWLLGLCSAWLGRGHPHVPPLGLWTGLPSSIWEEKFHLETLKASTGSQAAVEEGLAAKPLWGGFKKARDALNGLFKKATICNS